MQLNFILVFVENMVYNMFSKYNTLMIFLCMNFKSSGPYLCECLADKRSKAKGDFSGQNGSISG